MIRKLYRIVACREANYLEEHIPPGERGIFSKQVCHLLALNISSRAARLRRPDWHLLVLVVYGYSWSF